MKVLGSDQIRAADTYTIQNEPISSADLMERASLSFADRFVHYVGKDKAIHVFCGTGNNGGDGLAVSRLLAGLGYIVNTYVVVYSQNFTDDFKTNEERLKKTSQVELKYLNERNIFPEIHKNDVIIDALWGSGLTRPIEGFAADIVRGINASGAPVFSIDIPSGLFCDQHNPDDVKIRATHTISFQFPKLSFFMPENGDNTGTWEIADIGLHKGYIEQLESDYYYLLEEYIKPLLKKRKKFAHKGQYGHALIISGSYGKIGAAVLSTKACLRSGSGLVTTYLPSCGYDIIQSAVPSAMAITDPVTHHLTSLPDLKPFNVIGIGPGIGTSPETSAMFSELLRTYHQPLVIDADAVNILAGFPEMLRKIPPGSILTPHIGEFERLVGKCSNHYERLQKLVEFCRKYNLVVVLKGAYTAIATSGGKIFFNSTGNPGMATGGSGDVLTGLITGLLAQGYSTENAAKLGVYLHGLAGDLAAQKFSQSGLIAEDLIEFLAEAYKHLESEKTDEH